MLNIKNKIRFCSCLILNFDDRKKKKRNFLITWIEYSLYCKYGKRKLLLYWLSLNTIYRLQNIHVNHELKPWYVLLLKKEWTQISILDNDQANDQVDFHKIRSTQISILDNHLLTKTKIKNIKLIKFKVSAAISNQLT